MPASGMAVEVFLGEAVPNTSAAQPSLTANTNISNTPPPTGNLVPPQSPAGTSVTNTGRTETATQTYLSQFKIS